MERPFLIYHSRCGEKRRPTGNINEVFFEYITAAANWAVMAEAYAGFSTGQSLNFSREICRTIENIPAFFRQTACWSSIILAETFYHGDIVRHLHHCYAIASGFRRCIGSFVTIFPRAVKEKGHQVGFEALGLAEA
jgi:hypothetical protein